MQDKDHYYNMALKLYNNQSDLIKIKEKIIIGKKNSNLFKPIEFCKRLENLYKKLLI